MAIYINIVIFILFVLELIVAKKVIDFNIRDKNFTACSMLVGYILTSYVILLILNKIHRI
ncbi:MAG: hypothetical protein ACRC92_23980 [Peptostreptococcaceae bacterium]